MKHPEKCECPIHIQEDTTNVKYVAWAVLAFWGIAFLVMVGK